MTTNGTISCKIQTGGGLDGAGNPITITTEWSEPVLCLIKTNSHSNKGKYEDGVFTMATYEVLLEIQEFTANRIKLVNNVGSDLGEFQIQDIQFLENAGRIKIQV